MPDDSEPPYKPRFKRVILKISGGALRNNSSGDPIDPAFLKGVCRELKEICEMGVQVGVVVGGGNIFRGLAGAEDKGVDRTTGDFMGMLATVINGMAIMDALEQQGMTVRLQSAIPIDEVSEPFILRRAIRHLEKDRMVIFVAGTGNPYFSTDTAAALRASEINADVILKATNVDGVYDKDPNKFDDAVKYDKISFMDALKGRLKVMDSTAFSLCMDNQVPILVFNLHEKDSIKKAVCQDHIGTLVS